MDVEKDDINNSCPLISERKAYLKIISDLLFSLGIMKYKGKELILIGYKSNQIEIYDSNLSLIIEYSENIIHSINYAGQLEHNTFAVITGRFIFIYLLYTIIAPFKNTETYQISLLQTIKYENESNIYFGIIFSKAFLFDNNLYKNHKDGDKNKMIIDDKDKIIDDYNNELIISSTTGIFILEKKKANENDD